MGPLFHSLPFSIGQPTSLSLIHPLPSLIHAASSLIHPFPSLFLSGRNKIARGRIARVIFLQILLGPRNNHVKPPLLALLTCTMTHY